MDNAAGTMQYDRMPNKSGNTNDYRGGSLLGATQEMVDAYFMANGMSPVTGYAADGVTPIINEASGYKEDGTSSSDYKSADGTLYAPAGTRNMYVNREPRSMLISLSVILNGSQVQKAIIQLTSLIVETVVRLRVTMTLPVQAIWYVRIWIRVTVIKTWFVCCSA